MNKLIIAGITTAAIFAASTAQAGTMTDAEFFANINDLAYDDQSLSLEAVEFARMEFGAAKAGKHSHSPYSSAQTWNAEFNPSSGASTTSGEAPWVSIIHAPLYIDTY